MVVVAQDLIQGCVIARRTPDVLPGPAAKFGQFLLDRTVWSKARLGSGRFEAPPDRVFDAHAGGARELACDRFSLRVIENETHRGFLL